MRKVLQALEIAAQLTVLIAYLAIGYCAYVIASPAERPTFTHYELRR
jgi:hypothetical protein